MKDLKLYISAGIFILLTAVRVISPSFAAQLADEIENVLVMEHEQTVSVIKLGKSLAEGEVISTFFQKGENKPGPEPTPVPTAVTAITPAPAPTPAPPPIAEPQPTENPAVAAFLESQAAYAEYAVPTNVSYECPVLPFEYVSPVSGIKSSGFGYRKIGRAHV